MSVATKIGEHLSRTAKRFFGIDHPVDTAHGAQLRGVSCRVRKMGEIPEEAQIALVERCCQLLQEQTPEQAAERLDG